MQQTLMLRKLHECLLPIRTDSQLFFNQFDPVPAAIGMGYLQ